MTDVEDTLHRLNVRIGGTPTVCYFDSQPEFEKAREFAGQIGIGPVADKELTTMPRDAFFADANEFRKGILGEILADRNLSLSHSDTLDSLFGERISEVRYALRAQGWAGDAYDILTKDGARAVFKFDHAPHGRNVIGMSVNGIEDRLERPAEDIATDVTNGAQEHLKRNRRVDVLIVAQDGAEGAYSVAFDGAGQIAQSSIQWKPEPPDAGSHEVRLRMRRYVRFDGDPYVMSGDTWRSIEFGGRTDALWTSLLSGVPFEQAVQQALGDAELAAPSPTDELEHAQGTAAMYGMKEARVASQDDKLPSIGPVVAITPAYVIQNIGMNSAVLHRVSNFDKLPAMGARIQIRYDAGKAVVEEGRGQSPGLHR